MSETNNQDLNTQNNITPITDAISAVAQATQEAPAPQDAPKMTLSEYADQSAPAEQAPQEVAKAPAQPERMSLASKLALGIGTATLAVTGLFPHEGKGESPEDFKNPAPSDTYTVYEGDTLTNVAEKVAQNTPIKETMQEAKEDIVNRNTETNMSETSGLQQGDNINLPANSDRSLEFPGVQIDGK